MHDLIIFKDAVICDLITVGSEPPCLHILHCSRPAGPLEEALADIEFQNSYITVRHCSRFEFACYLYTRDTAWTLGCVPTHLTQASNRSGPSLACVRAAGLHPTVNADDSAVLQPYVSLSFPCVRRVSW